MHMMGLSAEHGTLRADGCGLRSHNPSLFANLFDDRVAIAESLLASHPEPDLHASEEPCVADAASTRRREFAVGRACARSALAELGLPPTALPRNADGTVAWPRNIIGSITHGGDYCAAVAARLDSGIAGIGIDLEPAADLPRELWDATLRPTERAWIDALRPDRAGVRARLLFSIKECAFKSFYAMTRTAFDFRAITATINEDQNTFVVEFPHRQTPPGQGRFRIAHGHIACAMAMGGK